MISHQLRATSTMSAQTYKFSCWQKLRPSQKETSKIKDKKRLQSSAVAKNLLKRRRKCGILRVCSNFTLERIWEENVDFGWKTWTFLISELLIPVTSSGQVSDVFMNSAHAIVRLYKYYVWCVCNNGDTYDACMLLQLMPFVLVYFVVLLLL